MSCDYYNQVSSPSFFRGIFKMLWWAIAVNSDPRDCRAFLWLAQLISTCDLETR
jgi:hypothetical protein